jgi:FkbM family methyltransferase
MAKDIPGSWRIYKHLIRSKYANLAIAYPLADESRMYVPAGWPRLFEPDILESYEHNAIVEFSAAIDAMGGPTIMIDCGADVGAFSRLVLLHTENIEKIYAIEPNLHSFQILKRNFDFIPKPTLCYPGGAARYSGKGTLVIPEPGAHAHTFFINPNVEDGDIPLTKVDDLVKERNCHIAIKIDVEGLELDVLKGAEALLRSATNFVVQFEAHPDVTKRCKIDPMDCMRYLNQIRPCKFTGCDDISQIKIDVDVANKAFFDQVDPAHIYNVIAVPQD